jgi:hypothetical protein
LPTVLGSLCDKWVALVSSISMTAASIATVAVSTLKRLGPNPTGIAPAPMSESSSSGVKSAKQHNTQPPEFVNQRQSELKQLQGS